MHTILHLCFKHMHNTCFSHDIAPIETLPRYIKGPLLRNDQRDIENSILTQNLWEDLEKLKNYF